MTPSTHMRSMPKQERGERRMRRLLDAAEHLFAERGYHDVTTNEIAARAQTSIGTLYRFFPNKEAIVHQLSERYVHELHTVREQLVQPAMVTMPLADLIDQLVDPLVALKSAHPGLVTLFVGPAAALPLPAELHRLHEEGVEWLEQLWRRRFPTLDVDTHHLYAVMIYQIRLAILSLAFSLATPAREQIIRALKQNLLQYVAPLDGHHQDDDGHTPPP